MMWYTTRPGRQTHCSLLAPPLHYPEPPLSKAVHPGLHMALYSTARLATEGARRGQGCGQFFLGVDN